MCLSLGEFLVAFFCAASHYVRIAEVGWKDEMTWTDNLSGLLFTRIPMTSPTRLERRLPNTAIKPSLR